MSEQRNKRKMPNSMMMGISAFWASLINTRAVLIVPMRKPKSSERWPKRQWRKSKNYIEIGKSRLRISGKQKRILQRTPRSTTKRLRTASDHSTRNLPTRPVSTTRLLERSTSELGRILHQGVLRLHRAYWMQKRNLQR